MVMQRKLDKTYISMAEEWAQLSCAERKKVGAILVRDNQIISDGFNGTPKGFDNACEDLDGKTKKEVLHAESNALMKIAQSNQSSKGATLYITLSPCFECAKLIHQAGISRVVFKERYSDEKGIYFLMALGVEITRLGENFQNSI